MASVSIISIAAGTIPEAMIALTALPASVVEGKVAKKVRVASGLRRIRSTTSVTMPSEPSLPTTTPEQIVAGLVEHRSAQVDHARRRAAPSARRARG